LNENYIMIVSCIGVRTAGVIRENHLLTVSDHSTNFWWFRCSR